MTTATQTAASTKATSRKGAKAIKNGKSKTHFIFNEEAMGMLKGPSATSTAKSIEYTDEGCPGLKAEFGRKGQGTYFYRYTAPNGKKRGMKMGTVAANKTHAVEV